MQIWAVDISQWPEEQSSKEALDPLLRQFFSHDADQENTTQKVTRYVRGVDRIRSLAALLLPRMMYVEHGAKWRALKFQRTKEGRPFLETPIKPTGPIDFNISHDGDWIVMAFHANGARVGIDVMSLTLPHYESSISSFLETMQDTMTADEVQWVRNASHDKEALHRLYDLWTYKEALTKNMGQGLGFDFKRVELRFWTCEGERSFRKVPIGQSILALDGQLDQRYHFTAVDVATAKVSSQIVVCSGPLNSEQFAQHSQISPSISQEKALQTGLLKIWTMSDLVKEATTIVNT